MNTSAEEVVTFGCRLNASEAESLRAAAAAGTGECRWVVVNTCAVTAEAERQARQVIRRLRREDPMRRIFVTGCASQTQPAQFISMPEVDRVIGNRDKYNPASYSDGGGRLRMSSFEVASTPEQVTPLFEAKVRAFIKVQDGCDHDCTFCIIPRGRGPGRSVPALDVAERVRAALAAGAVEVVFTGVDLTSWGHDLNCGERFGDLVQQVLSAVPELARLRLSSLDPAEIDDALWETIGGEPRLLPHLHLSLQAGDDLILKRMKRRHTRAMAVAVTERARCLRPGVALGADLIAGFPTENDAAFANTLALVSDCGLTHLHVFPYSARPGTPAARMPQVSNEVRRARARRLREAGQAATIACMAAQVGSLAWVLVEECRKATAFARTDNYLPVRLEAQVDPGNILLVRFVGAESGRLIAQLAA